eukprot:scaffold86623_cov60-Phaeocystis_antarctica.AAC.1
MPPPRAVWGGIGPTQFTLLILKKIRGTHRSTQLSNADHPTTGLMLSSLMLSKAEVPISKSELAPSTGRELDHEKWWEKKLEA